MTLLLYYPCLCCYSFLRKHAVSLSGSESVQVFLICLYTSCHWRSNLISFKGLSWTRLYGSWIYNYLCNQCLSPRSTDVVSSNLDQGEVYNIMRVCQWLATGRWFSSGPIVSSTNKTDWYNWNIVESCAKCHQTNKQPI